jgi:hypothetical protein
MNILLTAISDSESNILVGRAAGGWAFTSDFELRANLIGNYITFYNTEYDRQGFYGLGIISGYRTPGKVERNIWRDRDYYGFIPYTLISSKVMPLTDIRSIFGSTWNRLFTVNSDKLPSAKLSIEQYKVFIEYMLKPTHERE